MTSLCSMACRTGNCSPCWTVRIKGLLQGTWTLMPRLCAILWSKGSSCSSPSPSPKTLGFTVSGFEYCCVFLPELLCVCVCVCVCVCGLCRICMWGGGEHGFGAGSVCVCVCVFVLVCMCVFGQAHLPNSLKC